MNRFEQLCKTQEIQAASRSRDEYGCHLVRTDISANDVEFLGRAFRAQNERLERAIEAQDRWWE